MRKYEQPLGFVDIRFQVVYCNRRCDGANWYTVEGDQQIPVKQNSIRGYVDRLEVVELQRRGKDTSKLQLTLDCGDRRYVLEAGADSEFATSLVRNLAALTVEQLKEPIVVQPEPGEEASVLFARVRTADYRKVFVERDRAGTFQQALDKAIALITQAGGNRPKQSQEQSVEPEEQDERVNLMAATSSEVRRLGWKNRDAIAYIQKYFGGRTTRDDLTTEELKALLAQWKEI